MKTTLHPGEALPGAGGGGERVGNIWIAKEDSVNTLWMISTFTLVPTHTYKGVTARGKFQDGGTLHMNQRA